MRKVMMLAAMLAMVMVAAAPALAQATATGGDVQIQYQECPQIITQYAAADQANTGGGTGAGIAQDLGISQEALNACLQAGNDINLGGGETVVVEEFDPGVHPEHVDHEHADHADDHEAAASESEGSESEGSEAAAASGGVLPDTGGASLIALGAGALLVGGGLLARRIVR
jgi:hypothetical protein